MRKFWTLLGLLPMGALFQACAYGQPYATGGAPAYGMPLGNITVHGKVVAASTQKPIAGIRVEAVNLDGSICSSHTYEDGTFYIDWNGKEDSYYIISFKDIDGSLNGSFEDLQYPYYIYHLYEDENIGTIKLNEKK